MFRTLLLCTVFLVLTASTPSVSYYYTNNGLVSFRSEAPQELISATSTELNGLIDGDKKQFVFKVILSTFRGFNSALQREHFNEKYLETEKYPEAIFTGKIIEDINFDQDGTYIIRAKGKLTLHGVDQERIIKSTLIIRNHVLTIESKFNILLVDHNIKVPKVVHEKVASEISIEIKTEMRRKS